MNSPYRAVKVTDDVWWVGAVDWNIRDFHGYRTPRGSTYNAYLIMADKITLVDTVKAPFREEMLARIADVIAPSRIDYIVSNHSEMDHSGCLPEVIAAVKPEKVIASAVGVKTLRELFPLGTELTAVKDGETLSLGNRTLTFMETRMLHWPDSMFAYLNEEELLFSQDGFGMHLATLERFDDQIDPAILGYEAATYYANIILPYSPLVLKLLEKVTAAGLSPRRSSCMRRCGTAPKKWPGRSVKEPPRAACGSNSCRWMRCTAARSSTNCSVPERLPSALRPSTTTCFPPWPTS
jgi:flavorubredoxin